MGRILLLSVLSAALGCASRYYAEPQPEELDVATVYTAESAATPRAASEPVSISLDFIDGDRTRVVWWPPWPVGPPTYRLSRGSHRLGIGISGGKWYGTCYATLAAQADREYEIRFSYSTDWGGMAGWRGWVVDREANRVVANCDCYVPLFGGPSDCKKRL